MAPPAVGHLPPGGGADAEEQPRAEQHHRPAGEAAPAVPEPRRLGHHGAGQVMDRYSERIALLIYLFQATRLKISVHLSIGTVRDERLVRYVRYLYTERWTGILSELIMLISNQASTAGFGRPRKLAHYHLLKNARSHTCRCSMGESMRLHAVSQFLVRFYGKKIPQ